MIKSDQTAPDFTLSRDDGDDVTLSNLPPRATVLFFYPKDDTKGCTVEALAFTEMKDDFLAANTVTLGISRDSIASHAKFRAKYDLTIPLLSDEDGAVCDAYGVWVEKMNYGKKYMGIERTTVLIDSNGKIARIWNKVRVKGHVAEVLELARAL